MTKKLGFGEKSIPEKVAGILGVKPKPRSPLVDRKLKDVKMLIDVTRTLEQKNVDITGALDYLDSEDLKFVAHNTSSITVCMAILNGEYPEEAKVLAEKKVAKIGSEFKEIERLCDRIEMLERVLKEGYLSIEESVELLKSNAALSRELGELGIRDLYDLVANTYSIYVCNSIMQGDYPEDVRKIAERRRKLL